MSTAPQVLVVEDNPLTSKMLRIALESDGYTAVQAFDGRAALAFAERRMPDIVLQDLILPDMSGFELARQLRALPRGLELPIVALSGFLGRIDDARAAEAAFTNVLVKPVEPTRLLDCIRSYCPIRIATPVPSARGRSVLVVDDDPVQLKLIRIHFQHLGYEVRTATSAQEALRLARESVPGLVVSDVLMPNVDGFQFCLDLRKDPTLARVPVVLLSAWYQTEADRELARRVGADAFVLRTPDFEELSAKVIETFGTAGAAPVQNAPDEQLKLEHAKAVIRQLEHQLHVSAGLLRRCTLQAAQISLLSGVADALARKGDSDVALRDVLAATLDAAGISKGALFLSDAASSLVLRQSIGFSEEEATGLGDWFGEFSVVENLVTHGAPVSLASATISESLRQKLLTKMAVSAAELVPLVADGRRVGLLLLAIRDTDTSSPDAVAFARAMGNQLAQSLELASSFARLAASEHRNRVLTESAHDAICTLTREGVIREANGRMGTMLGRNKNEIVGHDLASFASEERRPRFLAAYHKAVAHGEGRIPAVQLERSDGELALVEFSLRALEVGGESLVFAIGRDVTEQARIQTQLMLSDRLASVGTMAAGVAHEVNNPLTTVAANLELAQLQLEQVTRPDELRELKAEIRDAREAADRVRQIVKDLRTFARGDDDWRGAVDVHRVLDSTLRMAEHETRLRASVRREFGDVPAVLGNDSRLGQVFLNLIVNAAQAIPEGHADTNTITVRTRVSQLGQVVVEIADTGKGMPPEVVKRLFTPFFTTKPQGVGTGLGLAISHRIVSGFGGQIGVESEPGKGTVFRVTLPRAEGPEIEIPIAKAVSRAPRRGRILVVDDEVAVVRTIHRMLSDEHEVVATTNSLDALQRLKTDEPFDVVLCDLMMPVMTGMDLYEQVAQSSSRDAERMVFLTGGAVTPGARHFLQRIPNACIEKPFALETLRSVINDRLR